MNSDTKSNAGPKGRLLTFPYQSAPAQARPVARDGYGKPITHVFGLRISGTVELASPFTVRRNGGSVEVFGQQRNRA